MPPIHLVPLDRLIPLFEESALVFVTESIEELGQDGHLGAGRLIRDEPIHLQSGSVPIMGFHRCLGLIDSLLKLLVALAVSGLIDLLAQPGRLVAIAVARLEKLDQGIGGLPVAADDLLVDGQPQGVALTRAMGDGTHDIGELDILGDRVERLTLFFDRGMQIAQDAVASEQVALDFQDQVDQDPEEDEGGDQDAHTGEDAKGKQMVLVLEPGPRTQIVGEQVGADDQEDTDTDDGEESPKTCGSSNMLESLRYVGHRQALILMREPDGPVVTEWSTHVNLAGSGGDVNNIEPCRTYYPRVRI